MTNPDEHAAHFADISAVIRDYLTNKTDATRPSFHATALTHRLIPVLTGRAWSHESDCDCARQCHHSPDEVCERCAEAGAPSLIDFVLARLEGDRPFAEFGCSGTGEYSLCAEMSERFKADWNAKRRIVEFYQEAVAEGYDTSQAEDAACAIAAVYADHPDFREWWRP